MARHVDLGARPELLGKSAFTGPAFSFRGHELGVEMGAAVGDMIPRDELEIYGDAACRSPGAHLPPPASSAELSVAELLASAPPAFGVRVGLALALTNACDAMETLSLGFVLPEVQEEFSGVDVAAAAVFVGMLAGGCVAGHAAQWLGRRRFLVAMLRLEGAAALLGVTSRGVVGFGLWRAVSGFAVGAAVPCIFALAEELIYPRKRRQWWIAVIASAFIAGSIFDSVLAWLMQGGLGLPWRFFYASTGLVPLGSAQLILLWVPESPCFLMRQGRRSELQGQLDRFNVPRESARYVALRLVSGSDQVFESLDDSGVRQSELRQLMANPWRGSLARLTVTCFAVAYAWYGLATWLLLIFKEVGVRHVYLAGVVFALSGIPGSCCCLAVIHRAAPERLLAVALAGTAASCVALSVVAKGPADDGQRRMSPALAAGIVCAFNSVATSVFNVLTAVWAGPFPPELQPFALSFMSVWMRIGSIIAQFVDGALVRQHAMGAMALISALLLLASAGLSLGLQLSGLDAKRHDVP